MTSTEFISGGYFIITRASRPKGLSLRVPQTFVSLSSCFAHVAPDSWVVDWEEHSQQEREQEAAKFGIPPSVIAELVEWATPQIPFPFSFSSLEVAQQFHQRFHCADAAMIVGIGLHNSLEKSFKDQLPKESNRGLGLVERLERKEPMARDGASLGFEPLGFDAMHFHSWLCNYTPEEIEEKLGVRINGNGLISSLSDAVRTTDFVREHGCVAIWEPWLIVEDGRGASDSP